jgi:hypothetical protein
MLKFGLSARHQGLMTNCNRESATGKGFERCSEKTSDTTKARVSLALHPAGASISGRWPSTTHAKRASATRLSMADRNTAACINCPVLSEMMTSPASVSIARASRRQLSRKLLFTNNCRMGSNLQRLTTRREGGRFSAPVIEIISQIKSTRRHRLSSHFRS